ncbi:MAG: LytTR family DNA-binding domain-containing protein, partial [Bacteroidota bacterium]
MQLNCVIIDDDRVSIKVLGQLVDQVDYLNLVATFEDPVEAANYLSMNEVDIVFLDVEMPKMSGLDMLRTLENRPPVILVSSKPEYAIDAFEFDVVDYILKPPQYGRFLKAVIKARERGKKDSGVQFRGDFIFVKSDSVLVKLDIREILWIEALADYIAIVTPAKKYVCHSTMKSIEAKLPAEQFVR